ncbi:MAG: 3-methyl-2-oxobutanoate dehydrogenase subunit beta [Candidatus Korarchaeota archaeon]|nr:3-methyl-2-oxobutanoate dehydrogenase subunit beta [Candidatus Korarchaeota archaeon]
MTLTIHDLRKESGSYLPGSAACPGCGATLAFRIASRVLGPNTVYVVPASCFSVIQSPFPKSAISAPLYNIAFPAAAATASGVYRAYKMLGRDVNVVVWAGDGGTVDIGIQALSGAAERGEDIIYVCYDNEAYMNTGIQRSGATPFRAWTKTTPTGKREMPKDMPMIVAAHRVPYVATASVGYPFDLANKFEKAKKIKGFRYIHIFSTCPPGWNSPVSKTAEVAKLAVDTYFWPLYEIENGKLRITVKPRKRPLKEFLELQDRFRGLSDEEIEELEKIVMEKWNFLLHLEKSERVF